MNEDTRELLESNNINYKNYLYCDNVPNIWYTFYGFPIKFHFLLLDRDRFPLTHRLYINLFDLQIVYIFSILIYFNVRDSNES